MYVQDAKGHWRTALRAIEGGDAGLYICDKSGESLKTLIAGSTEEESEKR